MRCQDEVDVDEVAVHYQNTNAPAKPLISYRNQSTPPGDAGSARRAIYRQSTVAGIERLGQHHGSHEEKRTAEQGGDVRDDVDGTLEQHASKKPVSISELYAILRRYAARGSQEEVELLVSNLIRERGESPNLKLYSAMVLCNIDPARGSAGRIKVLFRELEDSGLVPDAILFHDALKVSSNLTV